MPRTLFMKQPSTLSPAKLAAAAPSGQLWQSSALMCCSSVRVNAGGNIVTRERARYSVARLVHQPAAAPQQGLFSVAAQKK
jgi:hypothetical protein